MWSVFIGLRNPKDSYLWLGTWLDVSESYGTKSARCTPVSPWCKTGLLQGCQPRSRHAHGQPVWHTAIVPIVSVWKAANHVWWCMNVWDLHAWLSFKVCGHEHSGLQFLLLSVPWCLCEQVILWFLHIALCVRIMYMTVPLYVYMT